MWVYLNWAMGLRAAGCDVFWLESANDDPRTAELAQSLRSKLRPYGFGERVALTAETDAILSLDAVADADLLLNFNYSADAAVVSRFRRSALIDIDPGLLQVWLSEGQVAVAPHHCYFTIGETVGTSDAKFPTTGIDWIYTPPCVALDAWPVVATPKYAAFTTVSNWSTSKEWVTFGNESYHNDKRSGFEPFLDLPRRAHHPLTLAICQAADEKLRLAADELEEKRRLHRRGWKVVHAHAVAATPWEYQRFIQSSKGEFSCAKPSCVRLQNAWVSDRTLCYLASGKPAVVQHTGPSRILPDAGGIFRFHDLDEAARCLDQAAADYERQCKLARTLAEERFDAKKIVPRVLERALN